MDVASLCDVTALRNAGEVLVASQARHASEIAIASDASHKVNVISQHQLCPHAAAPSGLGDLSFVSFGVSASHLDMTAKSRLPQV